MFCSTSVQRLFACRRQAITVASSGDVQTDPPTRIDEKDYDEVLYDAALNDLHERSNAVLLNMNETWGINIDIGAFSLNMNEPLTRVGLSHTPDAVLVMQGWNKALAFRSMFGEAIVGRWRMLSAIYEIRSLKKKKLPKRGIFVRQRSLMLSYKDINRIVSRRNLAIDIANDVPLSTLALRRIERSVDPIAQYFGKRTRDLESLLIGVLDYAVRELCPHSQTVQREAYRPIEGSADPDPRISGVFFHRNECKNLDEYCRFFATFGLHPHYWKIFIDAFVWAMRTHCPYAQEEDKDDLDRFPGESAYARFVTGCVALPMIEANLRQASYIRRGKFEELRARYSDEVVTSNLDLVEKRSRNAFEEVLDQYPSLDAYFSASQRDSMGVELFEMVLNIIHNSNEMSDPQSDIQDYLLKQGRKWRELQIPIEAFALFGQKIIEAMKPMISEGGNADTALEKALSFLYKEAMQFVLYPLVIDRKIREEARQFYESVAVELNWPKHILQERLFEVNVEISSTGRYTHTGEELEIGARLAWRNSAKCIGRIAWNTLMVRDCRHCRQPQDIFNEVKEHLKVATGGANIQSVMTIFRPQHADEIWGMRFWSSQFVRYAGYTLENGDILGDPANTDFTTYLICRKLWEPPAERTAFDVLPLVLKIPSNDSPFLFELPNESVHQVKLEHPNFRKVGKLGYKWAAVPAISNFMMNLGGIKYPCMPFNGWFVSIEIARNLIERYQVTASLASAIGVDPKDKFLAQKISVELETAICHSFEKNGFTIVDPMTVGNSFLAHCKRERSLGRECPAQWSWIGGLVGPTNPTWHLEMRDYLTLPQYDYCCDPWQVIDVEDPDNKHALETDTKHIISDKNIIRTRLPKVLIGYGSETGNAESTAASLARQLKVCKPTILSLNEIAGSNVLFSQRFSYFFIICSTFGNGEPPKNAVNFFEGITEYDLKSELNFAVLALGSSLYPHFCKAGRDIDDMMSETGATSLIEIACVDEVKGSHGPISKWLKLVKKFVLPQALLSQIRNNADFSQNGDITEVTTYEVEWVNQEYSNKMTFSKHCMGIEDNTMQCLQNNELINGGSISSRSTRQLVLTVPKGASYESGDHLSVKPMNSLSMVLRFCKCFSYELEKAALKSESYKSEPPSSPDKDNSMVHSNSAPQFISFQIQRRFHIQCIENGQRSMHRAQHLTNKTLSDVLHMCVDLSLEKESYVKDLFVMLSTRVKSLPQKVAEEVPRAQQFVAIVEDVFKHQGVAESDSKFKHLMHQYPTVVHLLEGFKELFCAPVGENGDPLITIADILVLMPRLKPRYYSISSSAINSPSEVFITVSVVNVTNECNMLVKGVCSHHLAGINKGDSIQASIVESSFRAPPRESHPVIMVGTGTGLAPFMGFIGDRASTMETSSSLEKRRFGEWHLYFGCRNDDEIIYKDQMIGFESNKVIQLHLAQSRQKGRPKKYVQDLLLDNGQGVAKSLLSDNLPYFYICGDVKIARACSEACIEVLKRHGGMSRLAAVHHILKMKVEGRWQLDVWGKGEAFTDNSYHLSDANRESMLRTSLKVWDDRFLQNE